MRDDSGCRVLGRVLGVVVVLLALPLVPFVAIATISMGPVLLGVAAAVVGLQLLWVAMDAVSGAVIGGISRLGRRGKRRNGKCLK